MPRRGLAASWPRTKAAASAADRSPCRSRMDCPTGHPCPAGSPNPRPRSCPGTTGSAPSTKVRLVRRPATRCPGIPRKPQATVLVGDEVYLRTEEGEATELVGEPVAPWGVWGGSAPPTSSETPNGECSPRAHAVHGVEVAGIEPASSVASAGLLRAQPACRS